MQSLDSPFQSAGLRCAGTLLLPGAGSDDSDGSAAGTKPPPVIVMAHGFAGIRAMLMPYALRFAEAGYAVYLFDYRNFGDSQGQPRHWVDPARHLRDWAAAIAHVQTLAQIDPARMVLWGTSLSGGHVVCMAARGAPAAAIIAGHPLMSGLRAVAAMPPLLALRLTAAGLADLLGSLIGKPLYLPVIGHPGDLAMLTGPEAWDGMQQLKTIIGDLPWENKVLARVALKIAWYNPMRLAHRVPVPALVIAGTNDSIVPAQLACEGCERMPRGEFRLHGSDHFQPYYGRYLEENLRVQLEFLQRYVGV